jgi:phosphoadenosine phosphosulfate reductase
MTPMTKTFSETRSRRLALDCANQTLAHHAAEERIAWALDNLPKVAVLSSSFGAQSAVMLHLMTCQRPTIPVILIDTGYLFSETYQFVDKLQQRMNLNLQVYSNPVSPAWQEARFGERWQQGVDGINQYNHDNKVRPMERALNELSAGVWFTGLRRQQSKSRAQLKVLENHGQRWKVHPIIDWNDQQVYRYLKKNDLPYHPLWEKGYVSIGDTHTTRSLAEAGRAEETRFFGLKRECGLHEMDLQQLDSNGKSDQAA